MKKYAIILVWINITTTLYATTSTKDKGTDRKK